MTSRQAAWLALALIGVCVSVALPWRAGPASRALLKPVVILGVDGMDPGALRRGSFQLEGLTVEVLMDTAGLQAHMAQLRAAASGVPPGPIA